MIRVAEVMVAVCCLSGISFLYAQDSAPAAGAESVVHLWPNGAPGFEDRKDEKEILAPRYATNIHNPSLMVFLPTKEKATGVGIIVCPGGGHQTMNYVGEGIEICKMLNDNGIAGFVLKYRMSGDKGSKLPRYKSPDAALEDAQRAVRLVRENAAKWGVETNKVGMMGFSAGGQVTVWATTNYDKGKADATDPVEKHSSRPDFQVLIYSGSPGNSAAKLTKDVPPAFIAIGDKDSQAVTMVNYWIALKKAGVSAELTVYPGIDHAFGLGDREGNSSVSVAGWPTRMKEWLVDRKFITKR